MLTGKVVVSFSAVDSLLLLQAESSSKKHDDTRIVRMWMILKSKDKALLCDFSRVANGGEMIRKHHLKSKPDNTADNVCVAKACLNCWAKKEIFYQKSYRAVRI
jgi:hypothetical protein